MFWNTEYNAVAALPALFDVFLRDTQKVIAIIFNLSPSYPHFFHECLVMFHFSQQFVLQLAVAVDANRLISSAQLLLHFPAGKVHRSAAEMHRASTACR